MEQKTFNSTFIHYFPLLVTFLSLAISLVYIQNFLNMVSLQNEVIISLLRDIKDAPTTTLPIVVENSVPNTVPSTNNDAYLYLGVICSIFFIGLTVYFLYNSKPKPTESSTSPTPSDGSSTPPTPSDGVNENSEKFTKINLDLQKISQEREEILNKLNDMSEKSNDIGSIKTTIEELYDYLTDSASTAENVNTAENVKNTEKINTLIDQQAVINEGMKQVMSSNLGFIEGTKRVF